MLLSLSRPELPPKINNSYYLGDVMSPGDQEHGLHRAGQEQAQLHPGRGDEGALQVLGVQGEILPQWPAQVSHVWQPPRADRARAEGPSHENEKVKREEGGEDSITILLLL